MIRAITVGTVYKHPFADKLSVTYVDEMRTVFRTGDFADGSVAAYVEDDTVVDGSKCFAFKWLGNKPHTVKSKVIRHIRSYGFLEFAPWDCEPGDDLTEHYGAHDMKEIGVTLRQAAGIVLFLIVVVACMMVAGR